MSAIVSCSPVARSWRVEFGLGGNGDLDLQGCTSGRPSSVDSGASGEVDGVAEEIGDDGLASVVSGDGQVWPDGKERAGDGRMTLEKGSAAAGRPLPFTQSFGAGL